MKSLFSDEVIIEKFEEIVRTITQVPGKSESKWKIRQNLIQTAYYLLTQNYVSSSTCAICGPSCKFQKNGPKWGALRVSLTGRGNEDEISERIRIDRSSQFEDGGLIEKIKETISRSINDGW